MAQSYAFVGHHTIEALVDARLQAAGWMRTDAAEASCILSYELSQNALEDCYLETDSLLSCATKGSLLIDLSPSTPNFTHELAALATVSELDFVEAPLVVRNISIVDAFAHPGNLILLVAGQEGALRRARPVLDALSDDVRTTGGAGSAQLARAAHSVQAVARMVATVETHALFRESEPLVASCDKHAYIQAFGDDAQALVRAIVAESFSGSYTIEIMFAELSAALAAADDVDLILPQAEAGMHLLELMSIIGGIDKTPAALSLSYEDEAVCAEHGLDWSRADEIYPDAHDTQVDNDYVYDLSGEDGGASALDDYADFDAAGGATSPTQHVSDPKNAYPGFSLN